MKITEAMHQERLMLWAAVHEAEHPELRLLHHIPNGGYRNDKEGARLKRQGVKAGVPDLCLPVARDGYHGLYIELKIEGNKPTLKQLEFIEALNKEGYKAVVCYGWQDAQITIESYLTEERSK